MKKSGAVDMQETEERLQAWLWGARRVIVVGVGSSLRRDDFVGVEVVRNLHGKVSRFVHLVECETTPENFIQPISRFKPTHVLIIDAALLNLKPGSLRLVEPNKIAGIPISTHTLPLRIFCEYLMTTTGAKVALLAIQPKETSFGEGLTKELKGAVKGIVNILTKVLPR